MDADAYLARLGLDPAAEWSPTYEAVARLQYAHVTTVPFETLSITGDPHGPREGEGVSLSISDLYEKIVERERGGFCFELNGLFGWLLSELGFDADRIAARVIGPDGTALPPANHHSHLVAFDRPYVVDVGLGAPSMRRPLPLDGTAVEDEAGVEWRVVPSDRPDADYVTRYRHAGDDEWSDRYLFETEPRQLGYFEATCDYLSTAPESSFTGDPVVTIATPEGQAKLSVDTLTHVRGGEETERPVDPTEWHDVLETEFGLRY